MPTKKKRKSHRAYYLLSKFEPFPDRVCDLCGLNIADQQEGQMYWNPKGVNGKNRNICQNCFDAWEKEKIDGYKKWQEKGAAILREKDKTLLLPFPET